MLLLGEDKTRTRSTQTNCLRALEGESPVVELILELVALILNAVVLDHRGDETKAAASNYYYY
jgi:hypothetical protein